jgi:TolA-binding protein
MVVKTLKILVLMITMAALNSCIALRSDVDLATEQIRAEHNAKFKALADRAKTEIDNISKRLDEIEKTLQIDKKAQENKINLSFSTLDDLKSTIREINNRIDMVDITAQKGGVVQNQIAELEKQIAHLKEENAKFRENMILQLDELKPVENLTVTPNGVVRLPEDETKSYNQLVDITRAGSDMVIARRGWEIYSQKYPKSRRCDVVYWIGETYYIEKSYKRAIDYFGRIESEFPKCQKQEATYIRTAYSLFHIGQVDVASKVLDAMTALYPKPNFGGQMKELRKMIKEHRAKSQKTPVKKDGN